MIFLARFWDDADEPMRKRLLHAVESGQLELTTGGWVMTDEACATFPEMIDNLFEGHQWITSHFNSVSSCLLLCFASLRARHFESKTICS